MNKALSLPTLLAGMALGFAFQPALAAGPDSIAKSNRSLWPDTISSAAGFNRASRAEILVFANALDEISVADDSSLMNILHIKSVDRASIQRVRDRLMNRLLNNLQAGQTTCTPGESFCSQTPTVQAMLEASRNISAALPPKYSAWLDNASRFHQLYAGELIRLAALFPKVSSEIDTFSTDERSGFELPDRHFLLTFDDGPSNRGGTTDTLLPALSQNGIHATFYLLGERLQKRLQSDSAEDLQKKYEGQCVALHGWQHNSHQKWDKWQASVLDTQQLVKATWPQAYRPYFRPPYGQRLSDSSAFFAANNLTVALWNIDSQDWNAKISDSEAAQRVLTLMLVWRSGVILFHDVHPKAATAVPWLIDQTRQSGIMWDDCRQY